MDEQDLIDMTSDLAKNVVNAQLRSVVWLRAIPTTNVVAHAVKDGRAVCGIEPGPQWYPPLPNTRRCRACERKTADG